jgi:hypothetical protein
LNDSKGQQVKENFKDLPTFIKQEEREVQLHRLRSPTPWMPGDSEVHVAKAFMNVEDGQDDADDSIERERDQRRNKKRAAKTESTVRLRGSVSFPSTSSLTRSVGTQTKVFGHYADGDASGEDIDYCESDDGSSLDDEKDIIELNSEDDERISPGMYYGLSIVNLTNAEYEAAKPTKSLMKTVPSETKKRKADDNNGDQKIKRAKIYDTVQGPKTSLQPASGKRKMPIEQPLGRSSKRARLDVVHGHEDVEPPVVVAKSSEVRQTTTAVDTVQTGGQLPMQASTALALSKVAPHSFDPRRTVHQTTDAVRTVQSSGALPMQASIALAPSSVALQSLDRRPTLGHVGVDRADSDASALVRSVPSMGIPIGTFEDIIARGLARAFYQYVKQECGFEHMPSKAEDRNDLASMFLSDGLASEDSNIPDERHSVADLVEHSLVKDYQQWRSEYCSRINNPGPLRQTILNAFFTERDIFSPNAGAA